MGSEIHTRSVEFFDASFSNPLVLRHRARGVELAVHVDFRLPRAGRWRLKGKDGILNSSIKLRQQVPDPVTRR